MLLEGHVRLEALVIKMIPITQAQLKHAQAFLGE
jgi:hypothetical protein